VVGCRAAAHQELVREILARGHEIGNHSQSHDPFVMLKSVKRLRREVAECQDVLAGLGVTPLVFRPPVGITNPRLLVVLGTLGLACVTFSCRPLDFGNRRRRGLRERVLGRVRAGDIVLLHDTLPTTVAVPTWLGEVGAILAGLRDKGLRVVPLSVLLGMEVTRKAPPPGVEAGAVLGAAVDASAEERGGGRSSPGHCGRVAR
jgi:peptidoglycan/xylan/chitin deacetylase (PgdA/CDA1 family)